MKTLKIDIEKIFAFIIGIFTAIFIAANISCNEPTPVPVVDAQAVHDSLYKAIELEIQAKLDSEAQTKTTVPIDSEMKIKSVFDSLK